MNGNHGKAGHQIEKHEIKALRNADAICFDFNREKSASGIRAIKRAEDSDNGFEQTVEVPAGFEITAYNGMGERDALTVNFGFEMIGSAKYDKRWLTVLDLLRAGDRLTILWTADNNSELVEKAGLHMDSVSIRIERPNGKRLEFHIYTQISEANSARMLRSGRWG